MLTSVMLYKVWQDLPDLRSSLDPANNPDFMDQT